MSDTLVVAGADTVSIVTAQPDSFGVVAPADAPASIVTAAEQGPAGAQGPQGKQGVPGATQAAPVAVFSVSVSAGCPVAVNRVTGQAEPADVVSSASATVIGLAQSDVQAGYAGAIERGYLTLPDWSTATGATLLQLGATYFLTGPGVIGTQRPVLAGQFVTRVGEAISTITLALSPLGPIQL